MGEQNKMVQVAAAQKAVGRASPFNRVSSACAASPNKQQIPMEPDVREEGYPGEKE